MVAAWVRERAPVACASTVRACLRACVCARARSRVCVFAWARWRAGAWAGPWGLVYALALVCVAGARCWNRVAAEVHRRGWIGRPMDAPKRRTGKTHTDIHREGTFRSVNPLHRSLCLVACCTLHVPPVCSKPRTPPLSRFPNHPSLPPNDKPILRPRPHPSRFQTLTPCSAACRTRGSRSSSKTRRSSTSTSRTRSWHRCACACPRACIAFGACARV